MAHPLTLPAIGALVIAGAAFGLHLGQSAISGINPLYFQGAAVHPRDRGAAVEDLSAQPVRSDYAAAYGWEQGQAARVADGAPDYPEAYAPTSSYEEQIEAPVASPPPQRASRPRLAQQVAEEPQPDFVVEYANLNRYSRYQVEEAPAEEGKSEPTEYASYEE